MSLRTRRIGKALLILLGLATLAASVLVALEPWQPLTPPEIQTRVAALFRYGAYDVPHEMAGPDHPDAALLAEVAAGGDLSDAESRQYRRAIQGVLAQRQGLFRLLDNNIAFATDAGPDDPNNCGGTGIAGRHDLHDASALSNFAEMEASLAALRNAGPLGRIRHANRAYKSLTDLMVHLAPATQSVVLGTMAPLPDTADRNRGALFAGFRQAMHEASFAPLGSARYKVAITRAEMAYADLALAVQAEVTGHLSPMEQRLAGRWLSIQSISPRLAVPIP